MESQEEKLRMLQNKLIESERMLAETKNDLQKEKEKALITRKELKRTTKHLNTHQKPKSTSIPSVNYLNKLDKIIAMECYVGEEKFIEMLNDLEKEILTSLSLQLQSKKTQNSINGLINEFYSIINKK